MFVVKILKNIFPKYTYKNDNETNLFIYSINCQLANKSIIYIRIVCDVLLMNKQNVRSLTAVLVQHAQGSSAASWTQRQRVQPYDKTNSVRHSSENANKCIIITIIIILRRMVMSSIKAKKKKNKQTWSGRQRPNRS